MPFARACRPPIAALAVSALLVGSVALAAPRVAVLELEGDRGGRLRAQIEDALESAGKVELVSQKRYRDAAARKGLRGKAGLDPASIPTVAPALSLSAVVTGEVGEKFAIRILDAAGAQLWTKELPVVQGKVSDDHARRLAAAIAAAAAKASPAPVAEAAPPTDAGESAPEPSVAPPAGEAATPPAVVDEAPPPPPQLRSMEGPPGPPLLSITLQGTTTWRSYCARPGVSSCRDYDQLSPDALPPGSPRQFETRFPYSGARLQLELFPVGRLEGFARGFGLVGHLDFGVSTTDLFLVSGEARTKVGTELGQDRGFGAALAYRYFFSFGTDETTLAHVGLRAGVAGRGFRLGGTASVSQVPPTERIYPEAVLEARLPLNRWVKVDADGSVFVNPTVGPDDFVTYGQVTHASGWAVGIGVSGTLFGGLGYVVRFEQQQFSDRFEGSGTDWTAGGVASESYSSIRWGLTLAL